LRLAPTMNWLSSVEPIAFSEVPQEHAAGIKQLEALGLVHRRNARTCALQRERLKKMLQHQIRQAGEEQKERYSSAFGAILQRGENGGQDTTKLGEFVVHS